MDQNVEKMDYEGHHIHAEKYGCFFNLLIRFFVFKPIKFFLRISFSCSIVGILLLGILQLFLDFVTALVLQWTFSQISFTDISGIVWYKISAFL